MEELFLNREMAIVTCHFNWCGFTSPKRNLHRFIRQMSDYPLFGIELSLTDEFETKGFKGWTQIRVGWQNVCFQKESLINKLVNEIVPEEYTKIAWIDADVYFTNKDWYKEAEIALDYTNVIQLFDKAIWTDKYGRYLESCKAMVINGPQQSYWSGHPGFALAANRGLWNNGGLYSKNPMGNGDAVFLYSIFNVEIPDLSKQAMGMSCFVSEGESVKDCLDWNQWKERVNNFIRGKIGYIKGECIHEWHGDKKNRKYTERKEFLNEFKNDHMFLNSKNILEFTSDFGLDKIQEIFNYFKERQEDG